MLDADFWWDQAQEFRQRAETSRNDDRREELRDLADVCLTVAAHIEEHAASG